MLNKVSLFAFPFGLLGLLLVRSRPSFISSFRSISVAPLLRERWVVTFSLHGTNLVRVLLLTWTCSSPIEFRYDSVSNLSVIYCSMGGFPLQIDGRNMIPLRGQSPQEQHPQNVTI